MNHFADVLAFQGTGMISRPQDHEPNSRVKDVWLRALEYRIVETLRSGGFSNQEIEGILGAVMPVLKSGGQPSSPALGASLRVNGLPPEMVNAITESIAASSSHR